MSDHDHIVFEQIQFAAVTKNGFSDVAIMTMGEADGHGMIVDEKTISDFMTLSIGKSFPAYLTHAGALDENGKPADRLGTEIGVFSGFYREGNKVRARNFQFLDAFANAEPKVHATLMEMAQKFADKLGISPVIAHFKAWVMGDGSEVAAKDAKRPPGAANELPSMRIARILSCDFVQKPATNLGLFEAKVDAKPTNNPPIMSDETVLLTVHTAAIATKDGEIATLAAQHKDAIKALNTTHETAIAALQSQVNDLVAKGAKASETEKTLTAALAAKQTECEDAAKYDMRKAGGEALTMALEARQEKIPAPAATDAGRWAQYAALCVEVKDAQGVVLAHTETAAAKSFKAKFLTRK